MSSIPIANGGHHTDIRVVGCARNVELEADASKCDASFEQNQRRKASSPMGALQREVARSDSAAEGPTRTPTREDNFEASSRFDASSQRTVSLQEKPGSASNREARSPDVTNCEADLGDSAKATEQCDPTWHRIRQVRIQQGVSVRSMARRMRIDAKTYRRLENPNTDLTLSELARMQRALEVPLADLLIDRDGLSRPVEERAKLVKAMKTAVAIRDSRSSSRIARMANMLCEQLIDLMPELKEVGGWPKFGARRGSNALGKALCQPIDMSALRGQDQ